MYSLRVIKLLLPILALFTVFICTRTEEYPAKSISRTYFQRFEDVGTLAHVVRNSEYNKAVSDIDKILKEQRFMGINKVVNNINSNSVQRFVRSSLLRKKRAVDESHGTVTDFAEPSTASSDLSSSAATSEYDKDTSSVSFLQTTGEFQNKTEFETSTRISSSTYFSRSEPFSVSTERQGTTSAAIQASQCVQDTQRIFSNITNQWSLRFLDSWGKPGVGLLTGQLKFIGNYQECRSSRAPSSNDTNTDGFGGNYCSVKLASASSSANVTLTRLILSSASVEIGACLPSTCQTVEIFYLFDQGLHAVNLSSTFLVQSVDCRTNYREYTAATIVAIIFLSIIGAFMIIGTVFDIIFVQLPQWEKKRKVRIQQNKQSNSYHGVESNGYHHIGDINDKVGPLKEDKKHIISNGDDYSQKPNDTVSSEHSESRPLLKKGYNESPERKSTFGILSKILLPFSVYTNGKKLLNTSQSAGSLGAIHGIRFLSMSWVILGHTFIFSPDTFVNLTTAMPLFLNRWTFDAVSNALVSVDTFFAISGLLTAYVTTKEIQKKGWKINWGIYYFHRFWRLTPPYMLVLLVALGLHRFMGSGALWKSIQPADKVFCESNWWTNLLYINNFVNSNEMCMTHSWYLANDMQFYILSPLMIVPFFFNVYAGLGSCMLFLLASWITTGILSTNNNWPNTLLNGAIVTEGSLEYMHYYYIAPYCRIGPFVIGILTGYLLAIKKGKIHLKWYSVLTGWVTAISVALACVYGIHGDITQESASSVGMSAFYNSMARSAWGACICWVIVACVSGYGGPVNAILSWSPFVSLGRLTFMAYLIHPTVIKVYFENMEQLYYLNDTNFVITYLGLLVFTNLASFVLVLGFESPMIGLEKIFIGRH